MYIQDQSTSSNEETEPERVTLVTQAPLRKLLQLGFPAGSDGKESACNVGDLGSSPGLGRFPGEGNGDSLQYNPLQYSCLENSTDRGTWWTTVHGVANSRI